MQLGGIPGPCSHQPSWLFFWGLRDKENLLQASLSAVIQKTWLSLRKREKNSALVEISETFDQEVMKSLSSAHSYIHLWVVHPSRSLDQMTELLEGENELVFPLLPSLSFPHVNISVPWVGSRYGPFRQQSLQGPKGSLNLEFSPTLQWSQKYCVMEDFACDVCC